MIAPLVTIFLAATAVAADVPVAAPPVDRSADPSAEGAAPGARPGWLGVLVGDATDGGVQIVAVVPGGPAARSDLRPGDLLVGVGDRPIVDRRSFDQVLRDLRPGSPVVVHVLRGGRREARELVPGERLVRVPLLPQGSVGRGDEGGAGARLTAITDELRAHFGAPRDAGALVVSVDPGSPAARAGLEVGDVVIRAGGRAVVVPGDLSASLGGAGASVPMTIVRKGRTLDLALPPGELGGEAARRATELQAEIERLRARIAELEAELARWRAMRDAAP